MSNGVRSRSGGTGRYNYRMPSPPAGAYGLRLAGVTSRFLLDAPPAWPEVAVTKRLVEGDRAAQALECDVDEAHGRFLLGRVDVRVDREAASAEVRHVGELSDDDVAHPVSGSIGTAFAWWAGAAPLHAGGILAGEGVWGVVGGMEAGKSTLLAALALAGH